MGFFDNFKNSPVNPFYMWERESPEDAANKYLEQIPQQGKQYYNPFIERGARSGNILEGEYGKLLQPTSFIDEIMKHYSTSPGAQYQGDKLTRGIGATAAAGGFAGTPEHQREYGETAHKIMSDDMQQYLQNALGVYGKGLSGNEHFFDTGYNASSSLADLIGGTLSSQGTLGFKAASDRNADRQALMNALIKALASGGGGGGMG